MCPPTLQQPVPGSVSLTAGPGILRKGFFALKNRKDVAALLEVREKDLIYYSVRSVQTRYRSFEVKKRGRAGGSRPILEPVAGLKAIQGKLLDALSEVYRPPECVHGFVRGRSIATGALKHEPRPGRHRELLTIDLRDFFGSVNFGRIWGLLQARGYALPRDVATLLAQLTVHEDRLPQGAPTSPVLANMIAARMDRQLDEFSRRRSVVYTRYADDLTFSVDSTVGIPSECLKNIPHPQVADPLRKIIESNGFGVAEEKTKFVRGRGKRLITGLVVNERVNVPRYVVRQIRAMLHAWDKYGEADANAAWEDRRDRRPGSPVPQFREVLRGRIDYVGMVRGVDDPVYDKLYRSYCRLVNTHPVAISERPWNHLRRTEDAIWVYESEESVGTAVFTDHGLVTCHHVLGANAVIFHPRRPHQRVPATPLCEDKDLDLALLDVPMEPPHSLKIVDTSEIGVGGQGRVRGYPDYNPGQTLVDAEVKVVGKRSFNGVNRLQVDYNLSKGMSGGALLDKHDRVVGIIATNLHLYNTVIPAIELWTLIGACQRQ